MMANSKYASTRETTNFARVARIILGPCTDVLCAVLTKEISPPTLSQKVKIYLSKFSKQKQPPITKEQEKIVLNKNYTDFDITILYFLLRNISNIPPHSNQWGNDPIQTDRSVSANTERIRLIRNKYGHCPDISISNSDFNNKISEISGIIQDLESYLGISTIYHDAVTTIRNCCMDPEQETKYIKQLLNLDKKIQKITEESFENSCVPKNVKALYERDISKWREDDSVFVETHNFSVMLDQVRKQSYVTFVGVPGSGKTSTVRHIALILQTEGYDVLPIIDKNKIEDYCNSAIPQVFIIDDVLGVFGLNDFELHMIDKYSERLTNPINRKTKTLMTCREAVFRNEKLSNCVLVKTENVVHLQSKENALNDKDKQNLLERYKLDRDLLNSRNLASSSNMFPFLCKLFSSKRKFEVYGPDFFTSPVPCILKEINSLEIQNKCQYVSLVLLMANGNKLSEKILDNDCKKTTEENENEKLFDELKCCILKKCKLSTIENFNLIDALSEMEGTYTRKCGSEFIFIHDSMFEIVAYHFGHQFPELIFQYASSNYIANYIKVYKNDSQNRNREANYEEDRACEDNILIDKCNESEKIIDLCIQLHEFQYPLLAERLLKDLQSGEFYNVFGNEVLKNLNVLQVFIAALEKISYENVYNLLLSELANSSKICKWKYELRKISPKNEKSIHLRMDAHKCLINEMFIDGGCRSSVRGIAWVIFFGHHQILQNLLNQMIQETGNVNDLFLNCFNKRIQSYSSKDQGVAEDVEKDHVLKSDTDSDTEFCLNFGVDIEKGCCTDIDTYRDTNVYADGVASGEIYIEPVIIEQCRLICLGCYSGDLKTVQILLKHIDTDALNNKDWPSTVLYCEINPLIIACKYGFLDIANKLLEVGADINICVGFNIPLTVACENEKKSIVELLLKAGVCVNKSNDRYTPLQCACEKGYMNLVEELIKKGADVNLNIPLINACIKNHLSIVEKLITAGANVNLHKNGDSPLLAACENGHFNVVKKLITSGADVNIKIKEKTPIIAACDGGYFNVLKWLMRSGAKFDPKDKDTTILNFPCYWDYLNIVKRLIEMESSFNLNYSNEITLIVACYSGRVSIVNKKIKGGADVKKKDGDKTPLLVACYMAYLPVVKALIKAGADVNQGNEYISPLQVASYEGHLSIVEELNKAGLDCTQRKSIGKALLGAIFFGHLGVVKEMIACHVNVNLTYGTETPLTTACFIGHINIFKELIKAGADVNLNNGKRTPLTLACSRGHIIIVTELIKEGADVNQSVGKETPLTAACEKGQMEVVDELIKSGANINQSDGNKTPLTTACEEGHWKVVYTLIKAEASVNQSDGNKTPLLAACEKGHLIVVKELLKAGANVNQSVGKETPLTVACERGHRSVVKKIIKAGADVNQSNGKETPLTNACKGGHIGVVVELIKAGANVNQRIGNKTPLTAACEKKHLIMVSVLLNAGADVNQCNGIRTPLTAASERGYWDVISDLIIAKADVNQSDGNTTPLIAACERGHWNSVKTLTNAKADVNQSNGNKTPLTAACERGHLDVVRELIKAGADVNQSDGYKTPLTTACKRGHLIVKELIEAKADVNQIDVNITPLTVACKIGDSDVIKILIKAGALVNQSDGNKTPLIAACEEGHLYAVKTLLEEKATVNQCDGNRTPLTVACEKGHFQLVRELIKAGANVNQSDGNNTPITAARTSVSLSVLIVKHLIMAGANLN